MTKTKKYTAHRLPNGAGYVYRGVTIERTEVQVYSRRQGGRSTGAWVAQFYVNYPGVYLPDEDSRYHNDSFGDTLTMAKEYVDELIEKEEDEACDCGSSYSCQDHECGHCGNYSCSGDCY